MIRKIRKFRFILCLMVFALLQACATVQETDPSDPWEGMNRSTFKFNDEVDRAILKPIAKGYQWIAPGIVEVGIGNFFSNLKDIGVSINGFLQGKPKQGAMDSARFLVNTTAGIVGVVDVAKLIDLPKHEEDFAQTLAVWGAPRGPYVVLPLMGPSSVRGIFGYVGDSAMHPFTYAFFFAHPAVSWGTFAFRGVEVVDLRASFLEAEALASEAAVDRYLFFRSGYMQRRDYLINDGEVQMLELDDMDFDEDLDLLEEDLSKELN